MFSDQHLCANNGNLQETEPLTDDQGHSFVPIGHIALEKYSKRNAAFGFDPSTLWAKTFYISWYAFSLWLFDIDTH